MCYTCLNAIARIQDITKRIAEQNAQAKHGERIRARAEANRPWLPEEMDPVSLQRHRDEIATTFASIPEPDEDAADDPRVTYTGLHE